jgi:hypothetical protein
VINVLLRSVAFTYCYSKCHGTECPTAESHSVKCYFDECLSAKFPSSKCDYKCHYT